MISSKQIRAGRAILNWPQKKLAAEAKLSLNALNSIERDLGNPRAETLEQIKTALEDNGIEFLDGHGARMRGEAFNFEVVEGEEALSRFYSDFLNAFPEGGGEILYSGIDNNRFDHRQSGKLKSYKDVERILWRRGIGERLLFCEGDVNFLSSKNVYRWIPKDIFSTIPYTIYGDNVAIFLWGPPERVVFIRNASIAESLRRQFDALWEIAKPVPDEIHKFHHVKDQEW